MKISFEKPDMFIGMEVNKKLTVYKCVGYENYKNKSGNDTFVLLWDATSKLSGEKEIQKTSFCSFSLNLLQNLKNEKNPARVHWGKVGYAKRQENKNTLENNS